MDLICLFLAFLLAHFIRVHSYINLIDNGIYRNALLFILCADLIVLMLFESYTGVLRRGYYRELNIMVKQIIMIELAAGLYLFTVDDSRNFSRAVLYLTGIFYGIFILCSQNSLEKTSCPYDGRTRGTFLVHRYFLRYCGICSRIHP